MLGVRTPPPQDDLRFSNRTGILKKKTMCFIGVEVEQEKSAPPSKKILDPPLRIITIYLAGCLKTLLPK